jgi:hypothetical protein
MSQMNQEENVRNVVLVHGGFVDGSGWEGVYDALKKNGYTVSIVQNAMTSPPLGARLLSRTDRSFSVGHLYGGAVITQAGNDPQVAGLQAVQTGRPSSLPELAA